MKFLKTAAAWSHTNLCQLRLPLRILKKKWNGSGSSSGQIMRLQALWLRLRSSALVLRIN